MPPNTDTLANWIRRESYIKGFSKEDAFIGQIRLHNVLVNQIPAAMIALGHNQQTVRKELLRMIDHEEFAEELARESKRRRWARGVRGTAPTITGVETNPLLEEWIRTESSRVAFSKEGEFIGEIRLHNILINSITTSMSAQGYTPQSVRKSLLKMIDEGFSKELQKESRQRIRESNLSYTPDLGTASCYAGTSRSSDLDTPTGYVGAWSGFGLRPQERVMPGEIMDAEFPPLGKQSSSTTPPPSERTNQSAAHISSYRAVLASVQKKTAEAIGNYKRTELSFGGAFDETFGENSGQTFDKGNGRTFDENSGRTFGEGNGRTFDEGSGRAFDENSGRTFGEGNGRTFDEGSGRTFDEDNGRAFDEDSGRTFDEDNGRAFGENSGRAFGGASDRTSGENSGENPGENSGGNSGRTFGGASGQLIEIADEVADEIADEIADGTADGTADETADETADDSGGTVGAKRLKALRFPFCIQHTILTKIQATIEIACFKYARTHCPSILARKGWNCSHAGELNAWTKEFRHSSDLGELSGAIVDNPVRLKELDDLRDIAVHRIHISEERLNELVRFAFDVMELLGDKKGAEEIGEIAEVIRLCTRHCIESMDKLSRELDKELQQLDMLRKRLEEKELQIREKSESAMKEVENSMEQVFVDRLQALGLQSHYVGLE